MKIVNRNTDGAGSVQTYQKHRTRTEVYGYTSVKLQKIRMLLESKNMSVVQLRDCRAGTTHVLLLSAKTTLSMTTITRNGHDDIVEDALKLMSFPPDMEESPGCSMNVNYIRRSLGRFTEDYYPGTTLHNSHNRVSRKVKNKVVTSINSKNGKF